jgi:transcriptional regulator with XRE-family HTH domain
MHSQSTNLRQLMSQQGLTIEAVVRRSGLNHRTIRRILKGDSKPHAMTLFRLARGLGIGANELFFTEAESTGRLSRKVRPLSREAMTLHSRVAAILESDEAETLTAIVRVLYRRAKRTRNRQGRR